MQKKAKLIENIFQVHQVNVIRNFCGFFSLLLFAFLTYTSFRVF